MRCSSLYPPRWPTRLLLSCHVPAPVAGADKPCATETNAECQLAVGTSAVGRARDCRRSDAIAAVMQVRPLSVVSGIAGWSPFGRSASGTPGWL